MLSRKFSGLAIVETILVIAISSGLFIFALSALGSRERYAKEEGAKLVMADIARIRNQAQQGKGPETAAGRDALRGNEMFGEAVLLDRGEYYHYKLMYTPSSNTISVYESSQVSMPEKLRWYTRTGCAGFSSCYNNDSLGLAPISFFDDYRNILIVFRNGTGESYVFSATTSDLIDAAQISQYTSDRQGDLKLAFFYSSKLAAFAPIPKAYAGGGGGAPLIADESLDAKNARYQYYANMKLSIPNDQSLQVVR